MKNGVIVTNVGENDVLLIRQLVRSVSASTKADVLNRFSTQKHNRERSAAAKVLKILLHRNPTEEEVEFVFREIN